MSPALSVEPGDYDGADDPRNKILDGLEAAFEAMMAAAENQGCGFQLMQRLQRHMPVQKAEPAAVVVKPDVNAELELTIQIGAFARLMRRDISSVEHRVIGDAKRRAEADLQALKQARNS